MHLVWLKSRVATIQFLTIQHISKQVQRNDTRFDRSLNKMDKWRNLTKLF